jgi:hypothetical protein
MCLEIGTVTTAFPQVTYCIVLCCVVLYIIALYSDVQEMTKILRLKLRRSNQAVVGPIYALEISGSNTAQGVSYSHRAPWHFVIVSTQKPRQCLEMG